jgi:hypothetical protein
VIVPIGNSHGNVFVVLVFQISLDSLLGQELTWVPLCDTYTYDFAANALAWLKVVVTNPIQEHFSIGLLRYLPWELAEDAAKDVEVFEEVPISYQLSNELVQIITGKKPSSPSSALCVGDQRMPSLA